MRESGDRPVVMGIDPGLTALAVCCGVPGPDEGALVEFPVHLFESKPRGRGVRSRIARYAELTDYVMQVADRYAPRLVLVEGYSHASQGSAMLDLAEFGGFLRADLCELQADIWEVAPNTLKKFATGKGAGNKIQMVAAMTNRWGVGFGTDHEYDAYALARMASCIAELMYPETIAQREAINTVLNGTKPRRKSRKDRISH